MVFVLQMEAHRENNSLARLDVSFRGSLDKFPALQRDRPRLPTRTFPASQP